MAKRKTNGLEKPNDRRGPKGALRWNRKYNFWKLRDEFGGKVGDAIVIRATELRVRSAAWRYAARYKMRFETSLSQSGASLIITRAEPRPR